MSHCPRQRNRFFGNGYPLAGRDFALNRGGIIGRGYYGGAGQRGLEKD